MPNSSGKTFKGYWCGLERRSKPLFLSNEFLFPGRIERIDLWPRDSVLLDSIFADGPWEKAKKSWPGYPVVTSLLASTNRTNPITHFRTSIGCELFTKNSYGAPDACYQNSLLLFQNLRELQLQVDLNEISRASRNIRSVPMVNSMMRELLEAAGQIEDLTIMLGRGQWCLGPRPASRGFSFIDAIPRNPSEVWPKLRRIKLQNLFVDGRFLEVFLRELPTTIEEICLDELEIIHSCCFRHMLNALRKRKPAWLEPARTPRVKFSICQYMWVERKENFQYISIKRDLDEFFFDDGPNPYKGLSSDSNYLGYWGMPNTMMRRSNNTIQSGFGSVVECPRDFLDDWLRLTDSYLRQFVPHPYV